MNCKSASSLEAIVTSDEELRKRSDCVGKEVGNNFNFNSRSGKCSVILLDLQPEVY